MKIEQIYTRCLAQGAYYVSSDGEAFIIDPLRETDPYIERLEKDKVKLKYIFETHFHADFVSGHLDLSRKTNAPIIFGPNAAPEFECIIAEDGQIFEIGKIKLKVLHTPGHTPESISFLLTDTPASKEPVMLFTGDFEFVGDIGRPDLLEKAAGFIGTQEIGAEQMYNSIHLFTDLPDFIQVWPGHGAGSACGKALGAVPSTTVGYEKKRNWAFQYGADKVGFVQFLLTDQPEPPKYFAKMKELNKVNRPLLIEVPKIKELLSADLKSAMDKGIKLIDTRNKLEFQNGFIPGSINIQGNNKFATWMGWFVSYDEQFILIADPTQMDDLTRKLMRIGLDNILGFVDTSKISQVYTGTLAHSNMVLIDTVKANKDAQIIDIRGVAEYNSGHIEGAKNVFVGTLLQNLDQVPKDKPVILHCQGGDRAAIGYSLLVKEGYTNIANYSGGINEWVKEGQPIVS